MGKRTGPFIEITYENIKQFESVLRQEKIVLIEFYSLDCQGCREERPILEKIASACTSKKILFSRHRTAFNADVVKQFGVVALPTVIIFRGGEHPFALFYSLGVKDEAFYRYMLSEALKGAKDKRMKCREVNIGGLAVSVPVECS